VRSTPKMACFGARNGLSFVIFIRKGEIIIIRYIIVENNTTDGFIKLLLSIKFRVFIEK
jgi:hypothetical protein